MFLNNKYSKWYFSIISNPHHDVYMEKHHIIPKSLGGSNQKSNLVALSARQHFVAHLLLTKMTEGKERSKMVWALHRMAFSKNKYHDRKFTAAEYATTRKIFAEYSSASQKNKPKSAIAKQRMKDKSAIRWAREKAEGIVRKSTTGQKRSPEFCQKRRDYFLTPRMLPLETRAKMSSTKWVCHPDFPAKRVQPENLQFELSNGWSLGRVYRSR